MKQELKRVDPLRAANIGAFVYGLSMAAIALVMFPFFLIAGILAPSGQFGPTGLVGIVLLVFYPVMGVVMGWITGLLTSAIYNFIIRWTGGLLFEFDSVSPSSSGGEA